MFSAPATLQEMVGVSLEGYKNMPLTSQPTQAKDTPSPPQDRITPDGNAQPPSPIGVYDDTLPLPPGFIEVSHTYLHVY